ncbi:MAG: Gx transporter family protein [Clostridia bacterium]|nr:Gx transporter family protein [Clostridia bacterium]
MRSPIREISDKTAFRAICLAVILVLSWLEASVPLGVPGVKFGFSNLVILVCLNVYGFREALAMAVLKILMSLVLINGFSSFWYTAAGTLSSCLSMAIAIRYYQKNKISMMGVSAIGGFFHITSQYVVAATTLYTPSVFGMYPIAALLTLLTSIILGWLSEKITGQISNSYYDY